MGSLIAIAQLIAAALPEFSSLLTRAVEAHNTNDQATLDALLAQAEAAANALKPEGAA